MEFLEFKQLFQSHMNELVVTNPTIYVTDVAKEIMWATYLSSFPEEVRQSFNCNNCKSFIRQFGNLVAIDKTSLELTSIWDFEVNDPIYSAVVENMSSLIKSAQIRDVFVTDEVQLGVEKNYSSSMVLWNHLAYKLPSGFRSGSRYTLDTVKSNYRSSKQVFKRALDEISIESTQTVLDLIKQNFLVRGAQVKVDLDKFLDYQKRYLQINDSKKEVYCWVNLKEAGAVSNIRNSMVGTLLQDIESGMDLNRALNRYEGKSETYQRPNALISNKDVERAQKTIKELGLEDSLDRRFAVSDDIPLEHLTWVFRPQLKQTSVFDQLKEEVAVDPKSLKRVGEMSLDKFLTDVVPTATGLEILLENHHSGNLFSLITQANAGAPSILKWDNGLSWVYGGGRADVSIKDVVKQAGGITDASLRVSMVWGLKTSRTDLDLHLIDPFNEHIYYGRKRSRNGGTLDLDTNGIDGYRPNPVENIVYPLSVKPHVGEYELYIHNYNDRGPTGGFTVELEYKGQTYIWNYAGELAEHKKHVVTKFTITKEGTISFTKAPDEGGVNSKEMWGMKSYHFYPVTHIFNSPNYWETKVGNPHLFFALKGAHNPEKVRAFFNEQIKSDLVRDHKRVFEVLGSRIEVEPGSGPQISGLGFSSGNLSHFYCKVSGSFNSVVKVNI